MVPARPTNLDADDYEAIEEAVMETVRGRWFLAEFARRQRSAEMAELRELLLRLEAKLPASPSTGAKAPAPPELAAPTPAAAPAACLEATVASPAPSPPRPEVAPAAPTLLRVQPPQRGLSLAMIEAMPALEKLALFA